MEHKKPRRVAKPCVICRENTYDWDFVCPNCRNDAKRGRNLDKLREAGGDMLEGLELWEIAIVSMDFRPFYSTLDPKKWFPDSHFLYSDYSKAIRKRLIELANLIHIKEDYYERRSDLRTDKKIVVGYTERSNRDHQEPYYGTEKAGILLKELFELISFVAKYNYDDGFADGNRLLMRIARGELTVEELQAGKK